MFTSFVQEVESRLEELMLDVFGNYVVQKLLDHGGTIIQQKLVEKVKKSRTNTIFLPFGLLKPSISILIDHSPVFGYTVWPFYHRH